MRSLRPRWKTDAGQPRLLANWLSSIRAGSRDRKLYRELTYTAWRTIPEIAKFSDEALVEHVANFADRTKATDLFKSAFKSQSAPASLDPKHLLPDWLATECPLATQWPHRECLLDRAPLWIRLQTEDHHVVAAEFAQLGIAFTPSTLISTAWQIEASAPLQSTKAFQAGLFEIQDIGSQSLLHSIPFRPTGHWLDACAGAGGKTLQLARLIGPSGKVTAHDIRTHALQELSQRAERARLSNVQIASQVSGGFNGVLVDAPCSGSGTWRRSPHLKWITTPTDLRQAAAKQRELLSHFSTLVAPGGSLVYATCSLCRTENEAVVDAFQAQHPDFNFAPIVDIKTGAIIDQGYLTRLPADLDSDAFFIALFKRKSVSPPG